MYSIIKLEPQIYIKTLTSHSYKKN